MAASWSRAPSCSVHGAAMLTEACSVCKGGCQQKAACWSKADLVLLSLQGGPTD